MTDWNEPADRLLPIIEEASEILATHGWCQGAFRDEDGRVCLFEAIWQACQYQPNLVGASAIFLSHNVPALEGRSVSVWNDAPERTAVEVREALLVAIDLLKKGTASDTAYDDDPPSNHLSPELPS